jgi:hypothetical protein
MIKRRESGIWVTYWPPKGGGGQSTVVSFSGGTINAFKVTGTATSGVRFNDNGTVEQNKNGTYSVLENWAAPSQSGLGSSYEVRATLQSGTLTSGTTGTWLAISTNPEWTVSTGSGVRDASLLIEVRPNSGAVADSATYTLHAESST